MRKEYWPILDIPEGVQGEFSIKHLCFKAGHEFTTAGARQALLGGQKAEPVKFKRAVRFHELQCEGDGVWMTDVPMEQAQANNTVDHYEGNVLVGGLGLGYAAARIAANPAVDSVTVVEIAKEVIALTAPHLPNADKITVVHADLFEYLDDLQVEDGRGARLHGYAFDHAFYDIWQSDGEGTFWNVVVPLLGKSEGLILHTPDNWNEDVMRGQLYWNLQSNLRFMSMPAEGGKHIGLALPSLDELCVTRDDMWFDWRVPFFQWYRSVKGVASEETINNAIILYIQQLGRPTFKTCWPPTQ